MSTFTPILLGSDMNVYGMARAIFDKYSIPSIAIAQKELSPTKNSKIVTVRTVEKFTADDKFLPTLEKVASEIKGKKLLIPCSDEYAKLVSKYKKELSKHFLINIIDIELLEKLVDKASFYQLCETHQLTYPKTKVISYQDFQNGQLDHGITYPIALKASNSVAYTNLSFEGKQKAYIIQDADTYTDVIKLIYTHGYSDEMIVQEFIPGDDSHMRVLNAYVDQHGNIRMMFLGHPLLEDPSPLAIGNYVAILPDYNEAIFKNISHFLKSINYQGFVNFDMKYDERDNTYKVFEVNTRQGRSSFFSTLNGQNLGEYIVEDLVNEKPFEKTVYAKGDKLWIEVPKKIFFDYVPDSEAKRQAMTKLANGQYGGTLSYAKDRSVMRRLYHWRMYQLYLKNFKKYFGRKEEL